MERKRRPVYILHVPAREQANMFWNRRELIQEAHDQGLAAVTERCPQELLEKMMVQQPLEYIVQAIHRRSLSSFAEIWISGNGSSVYARAVIVYASAYNLLLRNKGAGPLLSGLIQWNKSLPNLQCRAVTLYDQEGILLFPRMRE